MRRRRNKFHAAEVQPDMNVTPLVDVVLVLLIIFMVVAPRMDQDVPIDLPGIYNPDPDVKGAFDALKVSIPAAGEFHIDEKQFGLDGAVEYLAGEHAVNPDRRLELRADSKLTFGDVRQLFARTQELGFPGVSLLVGERNRGAAATEKKVELTRSWQ